MSHLLRPAAACTEQGDMPASLCLQAGDMAAGALLELVRGSIASMDAATAAGNCDALHALFIRALDCRQQRPASLQNIDVVEGTAVGECPRLTWLAGVGALRVLQEGWRDGGAYMWPAVAVCGRAAPCQPARCYCY